MEEKDAAELFELLQEKNKSFAEKLNNSDKNNKRRLIRYIEVSSIPNSKFQIPNSKHPSYDFLLIGLSWEKEVLAERIHQRLIDRLENQGMIQEVSDLHDKKGLTWERLESFGLEYKFIAQYLQEKIDYDQMVELIDRSSNQFVKKQLTWFKRWEKHSAKINWLENRREAEKLIKEFLEK